MAARRRPRRPYNPHFWVQVSVRLRCHLGTHDVSAGEYVRRRRGDHLGFNSCEMCLRAQGIYRPERSFTFRPETTTDVRARQVGDDE